MNAIIEFPIPKLTTTNFHVSVTWFDYFISPMVISWTDLTGYQFPLIFNQNDNNFTCIGASLHTLLNKNIYCPIHFLFISNVFPDYS